MTVLRPRRDFHLGLTVKSGHDYIITKSSLREAYGGFHDKAILITGENIMGFDINFHIEISRGSALPARLPLASYPQPRTCINTRGDLHFDLSSSLDFTRAMTGRAGRIDNGPCSAACPACGGGHEPAKWRILCLVHLAAAMAG